MTRVQAAALTWVALILAIVACGILVPQPFGAWALGAIFEPYLLATGLFAGVVAVRAPRTVGRLMVIGLIAIAVARYVPAWVSLPSPSAPDPLLVSTWNIHAGRDSAARALQGISGSTAQLLAVQEVGSEAAAALTPDATGFDYTVFGANPAFVDVGLLSRYPILESEASRNPPFLRALVELPMGPAIVVYVVHAPLGRFVTLGDVPVGVDLSVRDPAIALIRARVEEELAQDRSVIVMGDFNSTEREAAYAWIAAGLRDAHLDAGIGPGFTWRPTPLRPMPFGLLRIDYVLSTQDLVPTSSTVDCSLPSDHCRLDVALTMSRRISAQPGNGYFNPLAVLKRTTRSLPER